MLDDLAAAHPTVSKVWADGGYESSILNHGAGLAIVVTAVKATVKGGLGKLRERPRGEGWRPGEPWRALSRPTWRPDFRAAVISRTRINLHRKIVKPAAIRCSLRGPNRSC